MKKKAILMCTCSFACPSMKDIDFGELSERLRLEVPHDYLALHPRLCEENGEAFMAKVLDNDTLYITPACKETNQRKLLRDAFQRAGVPMDDGHWQPVMMSFKTTDQVFDEVQKKVGEVQ